MRTLGILLILIALSVTASAIVVEDLDPNTPIILDDGTLVDDSAERDLQLIQRMAALENKFTNVATKEDITASTTFLFNNLSADFENKTDFMVIAVLLGIMFILAILAAVILILKARRRI